MRVGGDFIVTVQLKNGDTKAVKTKIKVIKKADIISPKIAE